MSMTDIAIEGSSPRKKGKLKSSNSSIKIFLTTILFLKEDIGHFFYLGSSLSAIILGLKHVLKVCKYILIVISK